MDALNDRNSAQEVGAMAKIDLNKVPRFSQLPIKPASEFIVVGRVRRRR